MSVIVYGKPACGGCVATKKALDTAGVPFDYRDVSASPEAKAEVDALGYIGVPVVVVGTEHWHGFRPDRIKALA